MNVKVYPHKIELETTEVNAGEYNITPVHFEFSEEYENLTKMALFTTCSGVSKKTAILNNECTIPYEVLAEEGQVLLGVYGYEGEEELELRYSPMAKSFVVKKGSYHEGDDPELPPESEWEHVLELITEAITETNNLNIEANKEDNKTTIIIIHKDGAEQKVEILDGEKGDKGDKGDAGAIKMQIVDILPPTGQDDTIYLVPLEHPDIQGNNYAEYVWINNQWELLGKIGVQVDLTDYYTKSETNTLLNGKQDKIDNDHKLSASLVSGLSSVATSGSYNDLSNTPDLSVYLNKSSVVNASSTTAGETYDVRYINSMIGDIETILTTLDVGSGV